MLVHSIIAVGFIIASVFALQVNIPVKNKPAI